MNQTNKVLLLKLYARQSARGNEYLIGRLGAATVIAFKDDRAELREGTLAVWNVYVQEPTDDGARRNPDHGDHDRREQNQTQPRLALRRPRPPSTPDLPEDRTDDLWPG